MSQTIGKYTYCQGHLLVHFGGPDDRPSNLVIGKFCSIGIGVQIFLGGNHRVDWCTTYPLQMLEPHIGGIEHPVSKGDVIIGDDVWIGMNSMIMSGVTIGDGAVIGAGSLVVKDVKPYALVAGNPAVFKKFRFDTTAVLYLRQMKWWNWPEDVIIKARPLLLSNNIEGLVAFQKEMNL